MLTDLETTIDKSTLLAALTKSRDALVAKEKATEGPRRQASAKHARKVATVLAQASKDVAAGRLKPDNRGRWCQVQNEIVRRVGNEPDLASYAAKIQEFDAAIYQVTHTRGAAGVITVTTTQVRHWLAGDAIQKSRRR
jgi:hypothetical protein